MPLGLHAKAQHELKNALVPQLAKMEVENNCFIRHESTAGLTQLDSILPSPKSQLGQRIAEILGDEPFSDFVYDQLSILLHRRTFFNDDLIAPLPTIEGFEDLERVAEHLVSQFESLPWVYSLFARLPYEIGRRLTVEIRDSKFWLNEKYQLIRFEEGQTEYPPWPIRENRLLTIPTENRFKEDLLYLNGHLSGYVGLYLGLKPIDEFKLALRGLIGIGIAERVFKPQSYSFSGDRPASTVVFRRAGDRWLPLEPVNLDSRTANLLHSVGPDSLIADADAPNSRFWANDLLKRAKAAFGVKAASERLLGSAQWLFDSHAEVNSLLAFVQAMVALEILFGDKAASDVVGVGQLLANRCAYSIAKTRAQRDEVLVDFRRIYDTRSKIVHRGHSRLSRREESDLNRLRWMVSRALQEEITLSIGE